jgi:hypothetical protein
MENEPGTIWPQPPGDELAVGDRLLRRSAQIDGSEHGAVHRVDHRRIRRAMTPYVDSLVECVE